MARLTPDQILSDKYGAATASQILHRLDQKGYIVITKSEHLALRRAAARAERLAS